MDPTSNAPTNDRTPLSKSTVVLPRRLFVCFHFWCDEIGVTLPLTTTPHVIGPLNRSNCRTPPTVGLIPLSVALHICFPYCTPIATVFALAVPTYGPLFLILKPSCHPLAFPICILYLPVLPNDLVEARHSTSTTKRRERCAVFPVLKGACRVVVDTGVTTLHFSRSCV
jgi:hypothetical protein